MGSAYVIQVAEGIVEDMHQMRWKTIIEVAKFLPNDATVTQAECTAVETAKAICCLARAGCICFHLDGNLIEDYNKNKTRKRDGMEEDFEDLIGRIKVEKTLLFRQTFRHGEVRLKKKKARRRKRFVN